MVCMSSKVIRNNRTATKFGIYFVYKFDLDIDIQFIEFDDFQKLYFGTIQ